jgi:hypothetical protein
MNNSKLDKQVKQYILDCIDGSGYDADPQTDTEKVKFLHDTFYAEYGYNVDRVGENQALIEWFMGLPSACHIEFRHYAILELAVAWGSLPEDTTEKQQDKILNNWFNLVAVKTGQLFRKHLN